MQLGAHVQRQARDRDDRPAGPGPRPAPPPRTRPRGRPSPVPAAARRRCRAAASWCRCGCWCRSPAGRGTGSSSPTRRPAPPAAAAAGTARGRRTWPGGAAAAGGCPAATPGSSGLSNHCSCTLRKPPGSVLHLGRLDHLVRLAAERSAVDEREVGDVEEVVGHEAGVHRRCGPAAARPRRTRRPRRPGRRTARSAAAPGRARPRPSARSARPAPASRVRPSPVRRSTYGRPTTVASARLARRPRSDSAAGCQARRSRGSVLRSPPASAPAAGQVGSRRPRAGRPPPWPAAPRPGAPAAGCSPARRARAAPRTSRPRRTPSRGRRSAAGRRSTLAADSGTSRCGQSLGDQAGRCVLGEPDRDERPAGDLDRPRHRRDLGRLGDRHPLLAHGTKTTVPPPIPVSCLRRATSAPARRAPGAPRTRGSASRPRWPRSRSPPP